MPASLKMLASFVKTPLSAGTCGLKPRSSCGFCRVSLSHASFVLATGHCTGVDVDLSILNPFAEVECARHFCTNVADVFNCGMSVRARTWPHFPVSGNIAPGPL